MAIPRGFWSYTHVDDDAENGRISQLARSIAKEYEMLSGEDISLFLDKDALAWGNEWKKEIDNSLSSVAFFIPVITPRYFQSVECRRELNYFVRRAETLGLGELIMPIKYVDFPGLSDGEQPYEGIELIRRFQWEDWTELRFSSPDSPEYRRAIHRMAARLMDANLAADTSNSIVENLESTEDDDAPGILDKMAGMESAFPEWKDSLEALSANVKTVGDLFTAATPEMSNASNSSKPIAARLTVARRLANKLQGPATAIVKSGEDFTHNLNEIDLGFNVLLERIPNEIDGNPDALAQACSMFTSIRFMDAKYGEALKGLESMLGAFQEIESMSRDLRPPLKTMRRGLLSMQEGRKLIRGWIEKIDESGLECVE